MKLPLSTWLLLSTFFIACTDSRPVTPTELKPAGQPRAVVNWHAFARLYGYVRYFHPSDEAAAIDWVRFAVVGARQVERARTAAELAGALDMLFGPIAPTVQVLRPGDTPADHPALRPPSTQGLEVVAWQHRGHGVAPNTGTPYASKRRHRPMVEPSRYGFAPVWQTVDAAPLRGRIVRLRTHARVTGGGTAQAWLRVDRPGDLVGFFDNMGDRPIEVAQWTQAEIIGDIAFDAERILLGGLLVGPGNAWFDSFELAVKEPDGMWQPVPLKNPGFEATAALEGWEAGAEGYRIEADAAAFQGKRAVRITEAPTLRTEELFAQHPRVGEIAEVALGDGLRARIPLALWSRDGHTLGEPRGSPGELRAALDALPRRLALGDPQVTAADVVITWNALQHFFPYFDRIELDWMAELDRALGEALAVRSDRDTVLVIQRLLVGIEDGHADVYDRRRPRARLPFRLDMVEGRIVITASSEPAIARGDIVLAIDGVPAADMLRDAEALVSGSPQWKRFKALDILHDGAAGSTARLRLVRGGGELHVEVARQSTPPPPEFDHPAIAEVEPGIWYVDLARASMADIDAETASLAAARGVVFDMRGYPNGNHDVLRHLLPAAEHAKWMHVALMVYPDRERIVGWEHYSWDLEPKEPRIRGKVAFLTGPGAISYAESVMGFVEHHRLGEIVGAATAGTNGNVNIIELPDGLTARFTGMRVTKHDGTPHYGIGTLPTVPAARTLAGVRAGRDEVLECGLAVVRVGSRR
jgi:C-terminal processing protease CtpA/Prc